MINRREMLVGMSAAALAASLTPASALVPLFPPAEFDDQSGASATQSNAAVDDRLRKDIERMEPRVNSEEGVPVLLACVNLIDKAAVFSPVPLNTAIASELRREAAAWQRIRPNSPPEDVGKVIEVLAYRDFANGGREPIS